MTNAEMVFTATDKKRNKKQITMIYHGNQIVDHVIDNPYRNYLW